MVKGLAPRDKGGGSSLGYPDPPSLLALARSGYTRLGWEGEERIYIGTCLSA